MNDLLEFVKYACWFLGGAGLVWVCGLYSAPAHVDLPELLVWAGVSLVLLILGLIIHVRQKSKSR